MELKIIKARIKVIFMLKIIYTADILVNIFFCSCRCFLTLMFALEINRDISGLGFLPATDSSACVSLRLAACSFPRLHNFLF